MHSGAPDTRLFVLPAISRQLGTCPRCMRLAFQTALIGWLGTGLAALYAPGWPAIAAGVSAGLLTALWLAHVLAFSVRWIKTVAVGESGTLALADPVLWPRRKVLSIIGRTFVFTLAATMIPKAAWGACNCFDEGCSCSDPAFPQCVYNPGRNESTCCGRDAVGCAAPYLTYCCPPGTSCYGDGSGAPYCWSNG